MTDVGAGQVVVITGASAGVGRAFAARGAQVALLARGRPGWPVPPGT